MRTVPVHNLRPNEAVWTPPAVAFFDTETRWTGDWEREVHELRCWSARLNVRRTRRKMSGDGEWLQGTDGEGLAETLEMWARENPTLWVYAHNLAFDLTVSGVTSALAGFGWSVTEFAVDSASPFVRMSDGRARITFADSGSWLPLKLDDVSAITGDVKLPLPANDAPLPEWLARCGSDVEVLGNAMLEIMDWWDSQNLGKWSVTGSSSGWNAMRHKIDARKITIHPDPAQIDADRQAVYGGRRGLWKHGRLPAGSYAELDFASAYPVIAASFPLPAERMAPFDSLAVDSQWITSQRHGVIAQVTIDTDAPRWPVRIDGRVWYPAGRFTTPLAGPDIAEAAALGALAEIGPGWLHRLGWELKPWAEWTMAVARGDDPAVPAVVRPWAKHCGRAIIGKWGQRGWQTIEIGPAPRRGWWATEGWDHTDNVPATIIDFDGRRWQCSASGDGDNCYPAILAWVESHVRVLLGRLIDSIPAGARIAADTDGVIIDMRQLGAWTLPEKLIWPLTARVKNTYVSADITGPQHMLLDGKPHMAGIPKSAKPLPDGRLTALTWPKMAWQMANSSEGTYVRPNQSYKIAPSYAPGWVTGYGTVLPVEVRIDESGGNEIVPWPQTSYAASGVPLGEEQIPALERYRDSKKTIRSSKR